MRPRHYTAAGFAAALLALLVNPVLHALGTLSFVLGAFLAVGAPLACSLVAIACGVRVLQAGDRTWGLSVVASAILAFVLGVVYGFSTVF